MQKIANKMNEKYELPKGRSINRMTLSNYNKKKIINKSPIKQGPKPALPSNLLDLLQCHVSMCQLSGTGECRPKSMKAIIGAAIKNTPFKDRLSVEYIYKKLRHHYPDKIQQSKAMKVEDWRMNWTTYANLNLWFDGSKDCLIRYGYVSDTPQKVIDIFHGREMPCNIPCKYCYFF